MTMPNFLIIGAEKCGTTSLYHYLRMHPEIYMSPVKEPEYFIWSNDTNVRCFPGGGFSPAAETTVQKNNRRPWKYDIREYEELFRDVRGQKAVGEASVSYLCDPHAAGKIKKKIPHAKLIAILRDPVDRVYSLYRQSVCNGSEPSGKFAHAIRQEEKGLRDGWPMCLRYKEYGKYYLPLKRYFDRFPRQQLKIFLYSDLRNVPLRTIRDVFEFLEVNSDFVPDISEKYNVQRRVPRLQVLHNINMRQNRLKKLLQLILPDSVREKGVALLNKWNSTNQVPSVTRDLRQHLLSEYREDIAKTQALIGRDLSDWLR